MAESAFYAGDIEGQIKGLADHLTNIDNQMVKYKEVSVAPSSLSTTNFSPTATSVGSVSSLLGVSANKIVSIGYRDANVNPAANLTFSMYGGTLYIAASQTSSLNSNITFKIAYIE